MFQKINFKQICIILNGAVGKRISSYVCLENSELFFLFNFLEIQAIEAHVVVLEVTVIRIMRNLKTPQDTGVQSTPTVLVKEKLDPPITQDMHSS